jgi:hypothetical protein
MTISEFDVIMDVLTGGKTIAVIDFRYSPGLFYIV